MNQKNSNISKGDQERELNLEEDSENINNTNNDQTVGVDVKMEAEEEASVQVVDQPNSVQTQNVTDLSKVNQEATKKSQVAKGTVIVTSPIKGAIIITPPIEGDARHHQGISHRGTRPQGRGRFRLQSDVEMEEGELPDDNDKSFETESEKQEEEGGDQNHQWGNPNPNLVKHLQSSKNKGPKTDHKGQGTIIRQSQHERADMYKTQASIGRGWEQYAGKSQVNWSNQYLSDTHLQQQSKREAQPQFKRASQLQDSIDKNKKKSDRESYTARVDGEEQIVDITLSTLRSKLANFRDIIEKFTGPIIEKRWFDKLTQKWYGEIANDKMYIVKATLDGLTNLKVPETHGRISGRSFSFQLPHQGQDALLGAEIPVEDKLWAHAQWILGNIHLLSDERISQHDWEWRRHIGCEYGQPHGHQAFIWKSHGSHGSGKKKPEGLQVTSPTTSEKQDSESPSLSSSVHKHSAASMLSQKSIKQPSRESVPRLIKRQQPQQESEFETEGEVEISVEEMKRFLRSSRQRDPATSRLRQLIRDELDDDEERSKCKICRMSVTANSIYLHVQQAHERLFMDIFFESSPRRNSSRMSGQSQGSSQPRGRNNIPEQQEPSAGRRSLHYSQGGNIDNYSNRSEARSKDRSQHSVHQNSEERDVKGNRFRGKETPNKNIIQKHPPIAQSEPKQPLVEASNSQKYNFGKLKSYWVVAAASAIAMAHSNADHQVKGARNCKGLCANPQYVDICRMAVTDIRSLNAMEQAFSILGAFDDSGNQVYCKGEGRGILVSQGTIIPIVLEYCVVVCCEELATSLMAYRARQESKTKDAVKGVFASLPQELQLLMRRARSPGMTNQPYDTEARKTLVQTIKEAILSGSMRRDQNWPKRNVLIFNAFDYEQCWEEAKNHAEVRDKVKGLLLANLEAMIAEVQDTFDEQIYTTLIFPMILPYSCVLVVMDNGVRMTCGAVCGDMLSDGTIIKDLMNDLAEVIVGSDFILGDGMMPDIRQANRWCFQMLEMIVDQGIPATYGEPHEEMMWALLRLIVNEGGLPSIADIKGAAEWTMGEILKQFKMLVAYAVSLELGAKGNSVKESRHCPTVFTGGADMALVDYHTHERYMPNLHLQRRDTAMDVMTRRADSITNKLCPKLKGRDGVLPQGTTELSLFQRKLLSKELKRLIEIHGKKEQQKYLADFRSVVRRLTSAHAGNLWVQVLGRQVDEEEQAEEEQLVGQKRTHDEAADKGKGEEQEPEPNEDGGRRVRKN